MEQRTLNIINICKGNTKYYGVYDVIDMVEGIKRYMADECIYKSEWYTDRQMFDIMFEAMKDYIDHCDKPSFFLYQLRGVHLSKEDWVLRIAIALSLVQVKDSNGNYVNGFDDRLHKLDREDSNGKT
jgi:hypothetical protein